MEQSYKVVLMLSAVVQFETHSIVNFVVLQGNMVFINRVPFLDPELMAKRN